MIDQTTPARQALTALTNSLHESIYFIPKEVKDWLSDPANGPLAIIQPWKKYDLQWWVFTCPPGEIELAKETLGVDVTHIFVNTKWLRRDMMKGERLFRFHMGQYDEGDGSWRYVDPDRAEREDYRLTSWKKGVVAHDFGTDRNRRRQTLWYG